MQSITGIVYKIHRKSRYTNQAKFSFTSVDLGKTVICLGRVDILFKGITYELIGDFNNDGNFEFSECKLISIPDFNENKKASTLLLSNPPFGFSPKEITKIIKKFEKDTIKTVIEDPAELLAIDGIEAYKALEIIEYLKREQTLSYLLDFLESFSVPTSYISKLYNFYGAKALEFLRTHPVKCGLDGAIPLNISRYLSKQQHLPISSNDNLTALVLEAITTFENSGHTYVEAEELVDFLVKYSQVNNRQTYMYAMQYAFINGFIKFIKTDDGKYLIFKTSTFNNEQIIADSITRISGNSSTDFNLNYEIGLVEKSVGFKYSKEQVKAIKTAFDHTFSIITGPAGCGKTSVLTCITKIFKKKFSNNVLLCAPTGKAATRMTETTGMSAYTVHRALGMKPVVEEDAIFSSNLILKYDLIIMDEASMLDNDLAAIFFDAIAQGKKVILLGDPNQLPSVGCGNILQDILDTGIVPSTRLTTVFRQGETSSIIINANKIINQDTDFILDDNFVFIQETDPTQIAVQAIKTYVDLAHKLNVDDISLLTPYRTKTLTGADHLNSVLEPYQNPSFLPSYTTKKGTFKVGDMVMRVQNDNKLDICNGSIGFIVEINPQSFVVDFDLGKVMTYPFSEFVNFDLAYANTVHKSQGSEYDTVIFICSPEHKRMLDNKILYTAITRAKKKVIVIGDLETFKECSLKKSEIIRNTMLKDRLILASKIN